MVSDVGLLPTAADDPSPLYASIVKPNESTDSGIGSDWASPKANPATATAAAANGHIRKVGGGSFLRCWLLASRLLAGCRLLPASS